MKYFISIILLFLTSLPLHAQGPQWIVYNTGNSGLPGNTVYSIAFEGNVKWFGTNRGLARLEKVTGGWRAASRNHSYIFNGAGLPSGIFLLFVYRWNIDKF